MYYGRFDDFEDDTTFAQWEKIAKLATKGDSDALVDFLYDLGTIDPRAANLLILAIYEHSLACKVVAGAAGSSERAGQLQRELEFSYRSAASVDPQTASKRCGDIEREIAELRTKAEHARLASIHASGIVQLFPQLFGVEPVGEGANMHYPPATDAVSPAVHDALVRLHLPTDAIDAWRFFGHMPMPTKQPKRMVSPLTIGDEE